MTVGFKWLIEQMACIMNLLQTVVKILMRNFPFKVM